MKRAHLHTPFLVCAVSIMLFVLVLVIYMHYQVGHMTDEAKKAFALLSTQEASKEKDQSLEDVFNATALDRAKIPAFFIGDDQPVSFIESIETLGKNAGSEVTLGNLAADDLSGQPDDTTGTIRADITVEGDWTAVMKTLILAENMPYVSKIHGVKFNTSLPAPAPSAPAAPAVSAKDQKSVWHLSFGIEAGLIHHVSSSTPTQS